MSFSNDPSMSCEIPTLDRRPSLLDNNRTLYPISFRHPVDSTQTSPSNSRRGSLIDHMRHLPIINSPNSSPSSSRRSSMVTTPENLPQLNLDWRRESLPSISYITNRQKSQINPSLLLQEEDEELNNRRHSIAFGYEESSSKKRRDSTPYSRSPELRISHKLAERKRRKEMKDLFDDLRDILPLDKGSKTSKWEILSKALEYIHHLHQKETMMEREKAELINELNSLKR